MKRRVPADRSPSVVRVCRIASVVVVTLALLSARAPTLSGQELARPRLVVAVVVDQLRADLLDRYEPAFTGGLRRLLDEGFRFTQVSHAHARTSTAPGHATIATGVLPSRHAVVANSWYQRAGDQWLPTYAVADPDSPILGFENEAALEGRSPRTMLRDALPDWLHAQDDDARIVSISRKDRAAIPLGGRTTEHVYWILPEVGRFVTSRYYMNRYPRWLQDFNGRVMPAISAEEVWNTDVTAELRPLARPDSAGYEGDGVHSTFPHVSAQENRPGDVQAHNVWGYDQPRADAAVMLLARTVIDELDLGQRNPQDLLAVSLSATDRVGHAYGPYSQEQLSNLIHLDRVLGDFLAYLDEVVGEGRWVLGLTGDHGVVTIPEAQVQLGLGPDARRISLDERNGELAAALRDASDAGPAPEKVAERLAGLVEERGLAAKAYTHHELTRGEPADSFAVLFRNSHYPGRAWGPLSRWGVEVRFGDGDLVGSQTGTTHESTYWYDRHVPMIFIGAGVEPGWSDDLAYTVDFAPTLADLAGIPIPDDLDGRSIY
jgi:predicted AlkP superfamily pyrophosphatase or phosphodiesterase